MKRVKHKWKKRNLFQSGSFTWTAVIAYALLIFFLSSRPALPESFSFFYGQDKLAHLLEYALLGWLLIRAFKYSAKFSLVNAVSAAVIISLLYGLGDELHQAFVPLRQCDFYDFLADALGVFIPSVITLIRQRD
ncbi:MAG: VanZ family protein [Candidatus Firestonebacteria bacterium]